MDAPSLIGRQASVAQLCGLLEQQSFVTVVGPPGMGKSRLALACVEASRRPAWWAELDQDAHLDGLFHAVARALDVKLGGDPAAAIGRHLSRQGDALLVLDGIEPLADEIPSTLAQWRELAPELRLLVTSRERLRVRHEVVFEVPPLEGAEGAAVLLERLRRTRPDHAPPAGEWEHLVAIANALDGIPLALELAVAPLEAMGAEALLHRLDDRLSLLQKNRRDARAGQTTLRRAIEDSWRLLSPEQSQALTSCAVFRGAFDLDAAAHVLGVPDPVLLLQDLRDRSLLWQPEPGRFRLYESVRVFAD
ncbi:MAG: AAA family ATPase, partial [Myxococcota bacterium]